MIPAEETFNGTWPFTPHFSDASGFRQHYVDEGPREAQVLICLHGEPTWGYLRLLSSRCAKPEWPRFESITRGLIDLRDLYFYASAPQLHTAIVGAVSCDRS